MAKLYLVRHGETDYNKTFRFQGQTDIPLNETGLDQARQVGEHFRDIPLAAVYSSSLKRAFSTAEAIAEPKGLTPVACDEFMELNFGKWEGMHSQVIAEEYAEDWEAYFRHPGSYQIPGGESMRQVQERSYARLKEILAAHPEGDVAVVAHGGIIRVLVCTLLGMDLDRVWNIHVANSSTTCFYYWGESYTLEYANMNYYLKQPGMEVNFKAR